MPRIHPAHYITHKFGVIRKDPQLASSMHDHHVPELVLVVRGKATHITPRGQHSLAAGDVFVIHEGEQHGYRDPNGFAIINILFDIDSLGLPKLDLVQMPGYHALFKVGPRLRQMSGETSILRLSLAKMASAERLAQKIEDEASTGGGGRFAALGLLMQLIVFLCREYSRSTSAAVETTMRIDKVLNYLNEHYMQPILAEELAKMANMSQRSFFRHFRKALGETPVQHLNRIRLQQAAELLGQTDQTIAGIGQTVGFTEPSYFTRLFGRFYSLSPKEYRERFRTMKSPARSK